MYVCLRPIRLSVCLSETSKRVCMYVCLRQLSMYVCMSQIYIHTYTLMSQTYIHTYTLRFFCKIKSSACMDLFKNAQPVMKTKHTYMLIFLRNSCFRGLLSMYVCFTIPLPVMENAHPRLSKTIDNCFSLNHVCMFEKSPKPLCLSCLVQFQPTATQRTASIV